MRPAVGERAFVNRSHERSFDARLLAPVTRGLAALYRADDGRTMNGATVSAWRDLGTGQGDLAQGSGASQPTHVPLVAGARSALRFDGSNDILTSGSFATAVPVPFEFLVAARITTNRDFGRVFGLAGSNSLGLDADAAGNIYLFNGSVGTFATNDGRWHVFSGRFDGAASFGAVDRGRKVTVSPGTTATSLTAVSIGGALAGATRLAGDVGELHIFRRALSEPERVAVREALMARWGLQ